MKRALVLLYATAVYVMFLGTFLYLCGFVGDFAVPKTIDSPDGSTPLGLALLINGALVVLFALQHAIMARPTFKRWWAQWVRGPAERATYMLLTNLALILLFVLWQPMTGVVWEAQGGLARGILWGLFGAGWLLVLVATFHFALRPVTENVGLAIVVEFQTGIRPEREIVSDFRGSPDLYGGGPYIRIAWHRWHSGWIAID